MLNTHKSKIFALWLLLVPALVLADYARTSYEQTASGVVSAGPCLLTGVAVMTGGLKFPDVTVILYDNASAASGNVLAEFVVAGVDNLGGRDYKDPVHCINGIYVSLSGAGGSYIVEYKPM